MTYYYTWSYITVSHHSVTNGYKSCPNDTVVCGYSNNELKLPPIRVRNSRTSQRECPIRSSISAEGMSIRKWDSVIHVYMYTYVHL